MAWWVEILVPKQDDLSSVPGTHMSEGESMSTNCSLTFTLTLWHMPPTK